MENLRKPEFYGHLRSSERPDKLSKRVYRPKRSPEKERFWAEIKRKEFLGHLEI